MTSIIVATYDFLYVSLSLLDIASQKQEQSVEAYMIRPIKWIFGIGESFFKVFSSFFSIALEK